MRDMHYELELFRRMEGAVVDGVSLTELELYDGAALWQRFHHALFDGDIKRFARTRSFKLFLQEEQRFRRPLNNFFATLAAVALSVAACISCVIRRPKVMVLSVDKVSDQETLSDFRIHGIYRALITNSIPFVECFHTLLNRSVLTNAFRRKRAAVYLESFDWWYHLTHPNFLNRKKIIIESISGTEDEIAFITYVITKYVRARELLLFRKKVLSSILRMAHIKAVVGIDDVRHYQEVIAAARTLSIPSLMVQHGHFTKYHVGWLGYTHPPRSVSYVSADALLVWSEYWKKELLRLGSVYTPERLVVSGYQTTPFGQAFDAALEGVSVILIPHETESPKAAVAEYIRHLAHLPNTVVYLKTRPDLTVEEQLAAYDEDVRSLVRPRGMLSDIPLPSVVCGVYSTFLYDMVLAQLPVLIMEVGMDYGEGMIQNGIADALTLKALEEGIVKATQLPLPERIQRAERLTASKSFEEVFLDELTRRGVL